jgi:hypothetical protein
MKKILEIYVVIIAAIVCAAVYVASIVIIPMVIGVNMGWDKCNKHIRKVLYND